MAAIRRDEQTKAAAEVGVTSLHFLGHMDGSVVVDMQLRHDISRVIRLVRPQVVIAQSPMRNLDSTYGSHPDHLAAAEATMCAVYPDARNPFAFVGQPCGDLEDWAVDEVWIPNGPDAKDVIDITATVDRKLRALLCHVSQHRDPEGLEKPDARLVVVGGRIERSAGRFELRGLPRRRHPLTSSEPSRSCIGARHQCTLTATVGKRSGNASRAAPRSGPAGAEDRWFASSRPERRSAAPGRTDRTR